ncbi:VOC family protein [Mycoplasmatota bacterium WC44]
MKLALYIKLKDNTEEVFNFYKKLFDAEEICMHKYNEYMTKDESKFGKVFHAEMKIKDSLYLYMGDSFKEQVPNAYKIVLEVPSLKEANDYFNSLREDGDTLSEMTKMPYGPTIGEVKDKFGITWNIVAC